MDSCKLLPDLVLKVEESTEDIYQLFKIIKPNWERGQIEIKSMSGGCSVINEPNDSLIVRTARLLQGISDSTFEQKVLKEMSSKGYFTPLLALFKNGYCYQYVQGSPLCHNGLTRFDVGDDIIRLVARQMDNIHSTKIPDLDYTQETFFDFLRAMLQECKPTFEGCPSISILKQELEVIIEAASISKSPLVLMHGDPHVNNIIWNKEKKLLMFVDWELCRIGPRAADIAYFLESMDYFAFLYEMEYTRPADYEKQFCKYYLERSSELIKDGKSTNLAEINLEQLLLELKYYRMVALFQWFIYLLKFEGIMDNFAPSFEQTYQRLLNLYFRTKKEVLGSGCFGRPVGNKLRIDGSHFNGTAIKSPP